jgi:hypothetical protein
MKRIFLFCAMISAAVAMVGCANQNTADTPNMRGAALDPGSVAPTSAGPSHQIERQRYQP